MIKEIGLKSGKTFIVGLGEGYDLVKNILKDEIFGQLTYYTINFEDKSYIMVFDSEVEYVREDEK